LQMLVCNLHRKASPSIQLIFWNMPLNKLL